MFGKNDKLFRISAKIINFINYGIFLGEGGNHDFLE